MLRHLYTALGVVLAFANAVIVSCFPSFAALEALGWVVWCVPHRVRCSARWLGPGRSAGGELWPDWGSEPHTPVWAGSEVYCSECCWPSASLPRRGLNTHTHTHTQKDRHTHTHTDRQTDRHTHTHRQTHTHKDTDRHTHTQTDRHRHKDRQTHTHRQTDRPTQTDTHTLNISWSLLRENIIQSHSVHTQKPKVSVNDGLWSVLHLDSEPEESG